MIRLLSTALALSLALAAPALSCARPADSAALRAEVIAAVNAERRAHGLPALKGDGALDRAAQGHACDNAARLSISHVSSDGSQLQTRLKRAGYRFRTASENTGRGFRSGQNAVNWWMNSPGHRKNILLSSTREIGVGIARSAAPDSRLHWIIVMGKSK